MISYFSGRARSSFAPPETALRGRRPGDPGGTERYCVSLNQLSPILYSRACAIHLYSATAEIVESFLLASARGRALSRLKLPSGRAGPACPRWANSRLYPSSLSARGSSFVRLKLRGPPNRNSQTYPLTTPPAKHKRRRSYKRGTPAQNLQQEGEKHRSSC